jgi:hypothetical protein
MTLVRLITLKILTALPTLISAVTLKTVTTDTNNEMYLEVQEKTAKKSDNSEQKA